VAGREPLFVFDLDGTLIDSSEVMIEAFSLAYGEICGAGTAPLDAFLGLMGAPFPDILTRLGLPAAIAPVFRRLSAARVHRIRVHRQVVDVCRSLRERGARLAIQTGKDRSRTMQILEYHGLGPLFPLLVAGDDPVAGKPAPEGVLRLCETTDVPQHRTAFIGDSSLDMAAGRNASVTTFGVLWGADTAETLREAGADHLIEAEEDLMDALASWAELAGAR